MDRSNVIVHVVDDEPEVLDSVSKLLESVGLRSRTYGTAQAFLDGPDQDGPGCLVLDLRLPDLSGLELQELLAKRSMKMPVILMSGHGDVASAVRAMRFGAVDFLEKPFSSHVLLERVEQALRKDERLRAARQVRTEAQSRVALLTPREAQVVELVTSGHANKIIARMLGISQKTVELHRAKAMKKLGTGHVADLVTLLMHTRPAR